MATALEYGDPAERLRIEEKKDGTLQVFLKLSKAQIENANATDEHKPGEEVQVLSIDGKNDRLIFHPLKLFSTSKADFLSLRYKKIRTVVLEGFDFTEVRDVGGIVDMMEYLPAGFLKNFNLSVGLAHENRFIVEQIEDMTDARELIISKVQASGYNANLYKFTLSFREFEEARKAIGRITNRAQTAASDVKAVTVHNFLAPIVARKEKVVRLRYNPMTRKFQELLLDDNGLDEVDHDALVEIMASNAERIATTRPKKLEMLRDEIQLVTLDTLITKFEEMMSQSLSEDEWQKFFTEHPFILSFVFGYPVVQVDSHVSVGGKKLSGGGEKIGDFLYKHHLTGNSALFEIKKPQTKLLDTSRPYRSGIFGPSKDLSGAVSQILDQRYHFQLNFISKAFASKRTDISSYAVACCVIIGCVPNDEEQRKSFEFVRANSRDVQIVTFDELLEKLKQLRNFLTTADLVSAEEA